MSPFVEAGNTHLPAPSLTRWVTEFLEELASFPAGAHDDHVDARRKRCNASFLRATRVSTYLKQLAPLCENCGTPTLERQTQCRCGICPKFESTPRDCIHSRDRITDLSQEQLAELVARYLHRIRHPAHYTFVSTQPNP